MTETTPAPDVTTVSASVTTAAPPVHVWDVLVARTAEWWSAPYLDPAVGAMHVEAGLGGRVWAGADATDPRGHLHGTVRTWDPPRQLEIGGVLVPGAYAGSITFTLTGTAFGTDLVVEQLALGSVADDFEDRATLGWTQILAALAAVADG